MLGDYLGRRSNRNITYNPIVLATIKIAELEGVKHGKITTVNGSYLYEPTQSYAGKDRAIFMAEFEGKRYKIIVELHVFDVAPSENDSDTNSCPPPKLIKVNGKPVSGASDYNFNSVSVTFADLAGGALGQTTGNAITLDTNAAGNNWYIDTTPFLPTSNPNEWVAKAGSAAAGKMDMLTVLLHEYGHALGIDHNPDAHDYMGTTLTAGIRRLPTPDEMALMGQLVAQAKAMLASTPLPNPLPQGARGLGEAPSPLMGEGGGRGWFDKLTTNGGGIATNGSNDAPNPFPTLPLGGMSLAFAGLLQRNRYGSLNAVLNDSTLSLALMEQLATRLDWQTTPAKSLVISHQGRGNVVQYAVAANSALVNGNLVGRVTPADATQQTAGATRRWNTQGSVTFTPATTLRQAQGERLLLPSTKPPPPKPASTKCSWSTPMTAT
jgi:hypothetical protein